MDIARYKTMIDGLIVTMRKAALDAEPAMQIAYLKDAITQAEALERELTGAFSGIKQGWYARFVEWFYRLVRVFFN